MVDQLRPVMRPRLYEVIVEQLCSHIADNEMVAGDRLPPERELAAKLGVSRASLSQALSPSRSRAFCRSGTATVRSSSAGLSRKERSRRCRNTRTAYPTSLRPARRSR